MRKLAFALAVMLTAAGSAGAEGYRAPRTAYGAPDLQGVWDSFSLTPLERSDFKTPTISDAEADVFERHENDPEALTADFKKARPNAPDVGQVHSEWVPYMRLARIAGQARTSVIIDPADGRLPLTPDARKAMRARRLLEMRSFTDPEVRPLGERCLYLTGPPLLFGDTYFIVQTKDSVVIAPEGNVDARVVRLDARHGPAALHPQLGDSIGWWEGDTLVVETVHFSPLHALWFTTGRTPISPDAKVTERFTRTGPKEIIYRFTVEDPTYYARPWSGVMPLVAFPGRTFEYACHEGNYALANILAGARQVEADGGAPEPLDGGDPPPKPEAAPAAN